MATHETREQIIRRLDTADRATRWRLLLGRHAARALGGLPGGLDAIDAALGALYEDQRGDVESGDRGAGLGASAPRLARWLGDIRAYFPTDVVSVIQNDAIERKGLRQLLLQPEVLAGVVPNVELAATLLALTSEIPEATKETARAVVRKVAEEIAERMRSRLERAVRGALDRTQHAPLPRLANLDVRRTIRHNLKNFDRERNAIVVDRTFFWARRHRQIEWNVIVCLDQSGSMASSLVYGAVMASILASLPALRTHLVVFDTEVVDLTDRVHDPVDVLFGIQLGGGTDINRAIAYCETLVETPRKTLLVLVSDLFEGGDQHALTARVQAMVGSGVKMVCVLALGDDGTPSYSHELARSMTEMGAPAFACTPARIPDLLEAGLRGDDLVRFPTDR